MGRRRGGGGGQTSRCTKTGAAAAPWRAEGEGSAAISALCGGREGGGGSNLTATAGTAWWNVKAREDGLFTTRSLSCP